MRIRALLQFAFLLLLPIFAFAADFDAGMRAYRDRDFVAAFKEWLPLARQGYGSAQYGVGLLYEDGLGAAQDYKEAAEWYRKAAEQGHALAQFNLALLYEDGHGVSQSDAEAARFYRKAAIQGIAEAQDRLGFLYQDGHGVSQDSAEAAKWYRLAADQGNTHAQVSLGFLYNHGRGVPQDYLEAARWYRLAAENGNDDAKTRLGSLYLTGRGVSQDCAEAIKWYRASAQAGNVNAQYLLGWLYDFGPRYNHNLTRDPVEAAKWFRLAADQGDALAQNRLGQMYRNGDGLPQDDREAVKWFRMAAEQGYSEGQLNLAVMFKDGKGVPQDYVQAHLWANLAASQGTADLAELKLSPAALETMRRYRAAVRDELLTLMTPEQLARAQDLARNWSPKESTGSKRPETPSGASEADSSGTGFWVNREGYVLTNEHVVDGCKNLSVAGPHGSIRVSVVALDKRNDLAVLGPAIPIGSLLPFSESPRLKLGQNIIALGYPLQGLLASSMSLTTGTVSALAGVQDDTRMIQITAPVQPGNSGGPLLDQSGNVVGVVSSKLNSLKASKLLGDVTQNVNFAIKASVVRTFLDSTGVAYVTRPSKTPAETTAIAEMAKNAVVFIECWK